MNLQFLGGAGTVTGSKYLVTHEGRRVLVDCGLYQGLKQLRLRNWAALPVDPSSIDAVVLTHAHIDHSGWVPRLVAAGFRGAVHATAASAQLCALLWPDSAHLQEEEARYANKRGSSKHSPALPLYTVVQARRALEAVRVHPFGTPFEPVPGMVVTFRRAGHILGAASVRLSCGGRSILFSGDLGRQDDVLMRAPEPPEAADTVLVESTYGDRDRPHEDIVEALAEVVARTAARGGVVVVPAFAVGRAQALLHLLHRLKAERRIPDLPVFLNSPMAADVTQLFGAHRDEHRLEESGCSSLSQGVHVVTDEAQSRALNRLRMPAVIVSASGMASGGRVVHHLRAYAPDRRNTILFVGYQAAGTRGAALVGGARTVKIFGEWIDVRAEVVNLGGLSAHADRAELLAWLGALPRPPDQVFVVHGEPSAADSLRQAIEERWHWRCTVPEHGAIVDA